MVARFSFLICLIAVTALAFPALADEAEDALIKQGERAFENGEYQKSKNIMLPLAEAGVPEAMHIIGRLHDNTEAFPNDPKTECDWYEKAANKGLAKSMYNMSICYDGNGRPDNPEMDKAWLIKAANKGFIPAMINLSALDKTKGAEYLKWTLMARDHGSAYARVSLWLDGYKAESHMDLRDFVCVTWNIIYGDEFFEYCD